MRANVKPLTHWIIYKGYRVRFRRRAPDAVEGILTTESGSHPFTYDPVRQIIHLADGAVRINEHGWELDSQDLESQDDG